MIEFFRDVLNGPLYIIVTIISIILIMAIIGFIMERKKLEKEAKNKIAVINNVPEITPIEPVTVQKEQEVVPTPQELQPISNLTQAPEEIPSAEPEVKPQVIVFEDPDEKTQ